MMESLLPRLPTEVELRELEGFVKETGGLEDFEAGDIVSGAAIAVFDHYMTDCPGYAGKVMVVVWSGSPSFHEVFVWRGGEIEKERLDPVFFDN